MSNKLKQIQAILANDDVRDPSATIRAIEQVLSATESPVATIKVFNNPGSKGALKATVEIEYSGKRLEPRHLHAALTAVQELGDREFSGGKDEECNDPTCPVHGNEGGSILSELFKQFEEESLNNLRRRKEDQV